MDRVCITGLGAATPLGIGSESFWRSLACSKSAVGRLDEEEFGGLPTRIGARVDRSALEERIPRKEQRRLSLTSQLAWVAAEEAIAQAGIEGLSKAEKDEVAVIIGSSIGGFTTSDPFFKEFYMRGKQTSLVIPMSMNSAAAANVSIRYGFGGPHLTADAACATSAHSIGMLYNLIRFGEVQIGVAGGADTPFARGVVQAWCNLRVVSERNDTPEAACRPFSADRDGMVLGEGAGVLVLESEASARRRDAPVLAVIQGYGASSDAHHITQPTQEGPARAMKRALDDAGLVPEQIDYVNAHATGTVLNDRIETEVIKTALGEHAYRIPVVGTKAATGHSIGASGALELISCVFSLRDQLVPPTLNYTGRDPDCDLDYVTEGSRQVPMRTAMSNSFAFGGSNASIVVGA